MIPKAEILELSRHYTLQPTTVQKDYVIGWILNAISVHKYLSQWVFKGGTCLKKCYFETYRFSEDLDFTIPKEQTITKDLIVLYLEEVITWVENNSGLVFPRNDWKVEEYNNLRGNISFQAKISYNGPLGGAPRSLPRVKFDITQDELLVDSPELRNIHHTFSDEFTPVPKVLSYSINEVLAEKSRALYERNGRARDVYDVVNISRNFRKEIKPELVKNIAIAKFKYKNIQSPSVSQIMGVINEASLRSSWEQQLDHQITNLPLVDTFLLDLEDALAWWLEPEFAKPELESMPSASGQIVSRELFPSVNWETGPSVLDQIRHAARNRLCAIVMYHGSERLVEPYSLRYSETGNELLHVWEIKKNGAQSDMHKSFKTKEIERASISNNVFTPRWAIEL